jgi:Domain of unknown function (DUF4188)
MLIEHIGTLKGGFLDRNHWLRQTNVLVQYRQSFEALEANAKNDANLPTWAMIKLRPAGNEDFGIYQETYWIKLKQNGLNMSKSICH